MALPYGALVCSGTVVEKHCLKGTMRSDGLITSCHNFFFLFWRWLCKVKPPPVDIRGQQRTSDDRVAVHSHSTSTSTCSAVLWLPSLKVKVPLHDVWRSSFMSPHGGSSSKPLHCWLYHSQSSLPRVTTLCSVLKFSYAGRKLMKQESDGRSKENCNLSPLFSV